MNEFIYLCIDFAELPDKTLSLLSCCSPDLLDAFDSLVSSFTSLQRHFLLQCVKKAFSHIERQLHFCTRGGTKCPK